MSADGLMIELRDRILVLTLANPPLNELSPDLRAGLLQAITERDPGCRGIVLAAEGPNFAGNLPLAPDMAAPSLAELCCAVADCPVPVVVGDGFRLFPEQGPTLSLELTDTHTTPTGVTLQTFRPAGRATFADVDAG